MKIYQFRKIYTSRVSRALDVFDRIICLREKGCLNTRKTNNNTFFTRFYFSHNATLRAEKNFSHG